MGEPHPRTEGLPSRRILVVDDEEPNLALISSVLDASGYSVLTAHDGEAALELLTRDQIDLALLDMVMPHMDGIAVCVQIRQVLKLRALPIIFTTGLVDPGSRKRAQEAGADDLVVKPIDVSELLFRIEHQFRLASSQKLVAQGRAAGCRLASLSELYAEALAELSAPLCASVGPSPELLVRLKMVGAALSEQGAALRRLGEPISVMPADAGRCGKPAEGPQGRRT